MFGNNITKDECFFHDSVSFWNIKAEPLVCVCQERSPFKAREHFVCHETACHFDISKCSHALVLSEALGILSRWYANDRKATACQSTNVVLARYGLCCKTWCWLCYCVLSGSFIHFHLMWAALFHLPLISEIGSTVPPWERPSFVQYIVFNFLCSIIIYCEMLTLVFTRRAFQAHACVQCMLWGHYCLLGAAALAVGCFYSRLVIEPSRQSPVFSAPEVWIIESNFGGVVQFSHHLAYTLRRGAAIYQRTYCIPWGPFLARKVVSAVPGLRIGRWIAPIKINNNITSQPLRCLDIDYSRRDHESNNLPFVTLIKPHAW